MRKLIALATVPALIIGAALGGGSIAGAQDQQAQQAQSQQGQNQRVRPTFVTFTVRPRKDSKAPYRFTVRGRVGVPNQLPPQAQGCPPGVEPGNPYCRPQRERACEGGRAAVRFKTGKKLGTTISLRRVRTRNGPSDANPWFCQFTSRVTFRNANRFGGERLKVTARFVGNAVMRPRSARARIVRVEIPGPTDE